MAEKSGGLIFIVSLYNLATEKKAAYEGKSSKKIVVTTLQR